MCLASRALAPDTHSGIARATRELAAGLTDLGHRVHVLARGADGPPAAVGGAVLHRVAEPILTGPAADEPAVPHLAYAAAVYRAVADVHEHSPVDVVLAPLWCSEGVVCALDERFPTVVSCMTSRTTIQEIRGSPPGREARQLIALERATMRGARYAHGLSRAALDKTLSDYGAQPELVGFAPRGSTDRARAGAAGSARAWDRSTGVRLLFVGRLERRKGVDVLLDAARRLAREGTDFSLVLAGRDNSAADGGEPYSTAFERDGGGEQVRFAGPVDDAELERLYRGADVVCAPSRYESHGVVLVEAMMFGKPIVACAAGGVPEVLEEEGNALLATAGEAESLASCLRRAIDDGELRRRFGERSRALYEERFESSAAAARMAGFLTRVSATHERAAGPPSDLIDRLTPVVGEVLGLEPAAAARTAAELIAPPAASWEAAVLDAEERRRAWQERALEAERQRSAADAVAVRLTDSRSWRVMRPLRELRSALTRR